jgi:SAM-dependent methyltransferase
MALTQKLYGFASTQLVAVAARLGIAHHIHQEPRHPSDLAPLVGAAERPLHRILRGLVNEGIVTEDEDGRFALTPMGQPLRSDVPGSLRDQALLCGELFYQAWGNLLQSATTEAPAFEATYGTDFFAYLAARHEVGDRFAGFMARNARDVAAAVVSAYNFGSARRIVDVGGGYGILIAALLRANPHLTGVVLDSASVVARAAREIEAAGLAERCEVVAGDFFRFVPPGGDIYLLAQVLHDWDDDRCQHILRTCREAMRDGDTLLVIEQIMPVRITSPSSAVGQDIAMLVLTGGRERTERELRALLASSGFVASRVIPTNSRFSIVEGVRS